MPAGGMICGGFDSFDLKKLHKLSTEWCKGWEVSIFEHFQIVMFSFKVEILFAVRSLFAFFTQQAMTCFRAAFVLMLSECDGHHFICTSGIRIWLLA